MIDNGSYEHVISVLNWGPFENFERVVAHLLLEQGWTDHGGGTWQILEERIEGRLVSASEPNLKNFAWMEATRGPDLQSLTFEAIDSFAARARAIGASHGILITTSRMRVVDVERALKVNRPPLTILDGNMIPFLMKMEGISLLDDFGTQ